MSPRPYRLGQRQAATEQTRSRILTATRELLAAPSGSAGVTIDAVAREAGVARMTIYYQRITGAAGAPHGWRFTISAPESKHDRKEVVHRPSHQDDGTGADR